MAKSDLLSEVYYGRAMNATTQRNLRARVHWICEQARGNRVLDVGCSQGIISLLLARTGFEVVGVDSDPDAIAYATQERDHEPASVRERLAFRECDVMELAEQNTFDTAILGEVLEHQINPTTMLAHTCGLVKPNGQVIITVPFGVNEHPDHKQTFYVGSLLKLILPFIDVSNVHLIGKWICCVGTRRPEPLARVELGALDWITASESSMAELEQRHIDVQKRHNATQSEWTKQHESMKAQLAKVEADLIASIQRSQRAEDQVKWGQEQITRLEYLAAQVQQEAMALHAEIAANRALLTERDKLVHDLQGRLAGIDNQLSEAVRERARHQSEVETAKSLLVERTGLLAELRQQNAQLQTELGEARRTLVETQKRLESTMLAKAEQQTELESVCTLLAERTRTVEELRSKLAHQENELEDTQRVLLEQRLELADLQGSLTIQEEQVSVHSARAEQLQELLGTAERTAEERQDQLDKLHAMLNERDRSLEKLQVNLEQLTAEIQLLQAGLATAKMEQRRLMTELQTAGITLEERSQALEQLTVEFQQVRQDLTANVEIAAQYQGELASVRTELNERDQALAILQAKLAVAESTLAAEQEGTRQLQDDVKAMTAYLGARDHEVADLRARLHVVYQISEWARNVERITHRNWVLHRRNESAWRQAVYERERAVSELQRRLATIEQSTKFQLGNILVEAVHNPLQAPRRLWQALALSMAAIKRRVSGGKRQVTLPVSAGMAPSPEPFTPQPLPPSDHLQQFLLVLQQGLDGQTPEKPENTRVTIPSSRSPLTSVAGTSPLEANASRPTDEADTGPRKPSHTPSSLVEARNVVAATVQTTQDDAPGPKRLYIPDLPLPDGPVARPHLKVACIFDEFTELAFRYEFQCIQFGPDDWKAVLERERPALLFVESAWHGNQDRWRNLIAGRLPNNPKPQGPGQPLIDLVTWCRDQGIPTVFWNKEDPPNFDWFIGAARLFDYVFTTDGDCIPRYKQLLGHDRVDVLPFAAQPRIHNPVRVGKGRIYDVAFAGTYYAHKHPERKRQMDVVLDPARQFNLHIFDRAQNITNKNYRYPDQYLPCIVGHLEYPKMLVAQKMYKVFLNINSVIDSPTMCARRVFELLSSGTCVVSGYSLAIDRMLGREIVRISEKSEDTHRHLDELLSNVDDRERLSLLGLRAVLAQHTYGHRVNHLLETVGLRVEQERPFVSVVAVVNDQRNFSSLLENVARQVYDNLELVVVMRGVATSTEAIQDQANAAGIKQLTLVQASPETTTGGALNRGISAAQGDYIAQFCDSDFYGPFFLADLMHAFLYTDAGVVGKVAHALHLSGMNRMILRYPDWEHRYVKFVSKSAMIMKRAIATQVPYPDVNRGEDATFFKECNLRGIKIYATDRFNYVHVRSSSVRKAELKALLNKGRFMHDGQTFDHMIV